jgi:hypothetical protein
MRERTGDSMHPDRTGLFACSRAVEKALDYLSYPVAYQAYDFGTVGKKEQVIVRCPRNWVVAFFLCGKSPDRKIRRKVYEERRWGRTPASFFFIGRPHPQDCTFRHSRRLGGGIEFGLSLHFSVPFSGNDICSMLYSKQQEFGGFLARRLHRNLTYTRFRPGFGAGFWIRNRRKGPRADGQ